MRARLEGEEVSAKVPLRGRDREGGSTTGQQELRSSKPF
jgi:hypothetical protein